MNVSHFFHVLELYSILPHRTSLYRVSFSCKQPAFYDVFKLHRPTPLKKFHAELMLLILSFPRNPLAFDFSHEFKSL